MRKTTTRLALSIAATLMLSSIASAELIGYWPFEEGSGDTTADLSPSGTTGMISNGATGGSGDGGSVWVNDAANDAARGSVLGFSGAADGAYVRAGSIPQMTLENDFTWAFFANHSPDNDDPNNIVLGNRLDDSDPPADFVPRQFIKFTPSAFEWHMDGNGNDNLDYPDFIDSAGEWHHHAVVKTGPNLVYYFDGVEGSTGAITQALDVPQPLFMGGDNEGSDGENWQGMLDEVRIFNHALSGEEVAALVPEPAGASLMLLGMLALGYLRRRR